MNIKKLLTIVLTLSSMYVYSSDRFFDLSSPLIQKKEFDFFTKWFENIPANQLFENLGEVSFEINPNVPFSQFASTGVCISCSTVRTPYKIGINLFTNDIKKSKMPLMGLIMTLSHEIAHHRNILFHNNPKYKTNEPSADYYAPKVFFKVLNFISKRSKQNYIFNKKRNHLELYKEVKEKCRKATQLNTCQLGLLAAFDAVNTIAKYNTPTNKKRNYNRVSFLKTENQTFSPDNYPSNQCRLEILTHSVKCYANNIMIQECKIPKCLESLE